MKITIDENICIEKGLDLPSLLAILLVKTDVDISFLFKTLQEKQILIKDILGNYNVTQKWSELADSIILSSDPYIMKEENIEKLAIELMEIFPNGKKEGTSTYWKGNKKDIKLRLQKFFKLYGNKYTNNDIINATKNYVNSFNGNYKYMRILKYFIWKDDKKINSEGKIYIEEVSDLATFIENYNSNINTNKEWTIDLK